MDKLRFALLGCAFMFSMQAACSSGGAVKSTDSPNKSIQIESAKLGSIRTLYKIDDQFWIASQPTAEDLARVKSAGIRTILNIRQTSELSYDEASVARELGLDYIQIPVTAETLTDKDIDALVAVLSHAPSRPVFLHCASANRTGAVWALYRIRHDGLGFDAAIAEAYALGMKSPKLEEVVRAHAK